MARFNSLLMLLAFIATAGCAQASSMPKPLRVQAFCDGDRTLDVQRLRRVVGAVIDGDLFKSPAGQFNYKVKPQLDRFGGGVGYWRPSAFSLPKITRPHEKHGALLQAVAVPDNGTFDRNRLVYLGISTPDQRLIYWMTGASADKENVCV